MSTFLSLGATQFTFPPLSISNLRGGKLDVRPRTLIVHYDGSRVGNDQAFFDIVFNPNASDDYDYLHGVDGP
jgi:hypothetical protein